MPTPCFEKLIYGPTVSVSPLDTTTNVEIPFTGQHKLQSDVVYGEDGVQPLYTKNNLEVEAVIYKETFTGPGDNVEAEVARIRQVLSTPSLQLKLYPIGLGNHFSVNISQPDVKGGPFPQRLIVEPIASNNAILIRYSLEFYTVECPSPLSIPLLQYNVQQQLNVDDDGNMGFKVDVTYQLKDPIVDPETHNSLINIITRNVDKSFQGYRQETTTKLSRDMRRMDISIDIKEIHSDNAFYPYTSNIEIDDEMESSLFGSNALQGRGFYTWKRTIGGTINLPPRIHKGYAWIVFLKILRERFRRLYPASKTAAVLDADPPSGDPTTDEDRQTDYYLPLKMKFKNRLYKREMQFQVDYVVVCDLKNLWNVGKLFARVNTSFEDTETADSGDTTADSGSPVNQGAPKTLSAQWKEWQDTRTRRINGLFQYDLNGVPIVYSQCNGEHSIHKAAGNTVLPLEDDPDADGESETGADEKAYDGAYPEDDLSEKYSWVKYDNDFEIIEDVSNIPVSYLEEPSDSYYKNTEGDGVYVNRSVNAMSLNGKRLKSQQDYPNVNIARGASTFYVRMRGYALRVKYKIPIPFIVSVSNQPAVRVASRASHKQISVGDIPIYLAKWDITYQVQGGDIYAEDIISRIVTSGVPGNYQ